MYIKNCCMRRGVDCSCINSVHPVPLFIQCIEMIPGLHTYIYIYTILTANKMIFRAVDEPYNLNLLHSDKKKII